MKKLIFQVLIVIMISAFSACKKDKSELIKYTLSGTASSPTMNDADNRAAKTFIDFTNGQMYDYATALSNQSTTDMVLRTSFYSGQPPVSTKNLFVSSIKVDVNSAVAWGGDGNLDDFGVRNSTQLAMVSNDKIVFDNVVDDVSLNDAFSKIPPNTFGNYSQGFNDANYVLAFKLQSGRKGILRVTNYNANKPFSFIIDVKMEK